jgi:heterodisulfide reductase subunit A-like polyferredoxin
VANGKIGAVLVVGGGIGGMQASLDLANAGYKVYLVERSTAIGGRMAQLDKTFPTNDCSMCTISPKLIEVDKHLSIDIITNAEVESIEGKPGNFQVRVSKQPRFIDLEKCNACGDCMEVCPVAVPSEFDEGLMPRKAVFKAYPQAIPNAAAISKLNRPPCVLTCPAHVNCQGYVALIAVGKFKEALGLIRERNPLPSVCGRICHHPCEAVCNRGDIDEPVAINPLKRFVADYVRTHPAEGGEEGADASASLPIDPNKPRIAIVGAGPAGLAAARDLALLGYPVTIFEALSAAGGMLLAGVPRYRLPKDILQHDIDEILKLGIELKTNTSIGKDLSLDDLRRDGYKAIFLAIGLWKGRDLSIEGMDLKGVLQGIDFLKQVSLGAEVRLPPRVLVIGGGNVAIDVALTALRVGAREVQLACLEGREEMPAHEWEIADALEEGVILNTSWGPRRILGEGGNVKGIELVRCTSVFDEEGRFNPSFDETVTTKLETDMVMVAIGQRPDLTGLEGVAGIATTPAGTMQADPLTLETGSEGVFIGGDAVLGPRSAIEAIAQGHEAAISINRYLRGEDLRADRAKKETEPAPAPEGPIEKKPRVPEPKLPVSKRRGTFKEIALTLSEEAAMAEAKRCLNCGLCSECLQCVAACGAQAIDHYMLPEEIVLDVGAVILTPGYEPFDPRLKGEYGYGRFANVITGMEFERILSASGPYQGHVHRPSDRQEPKKVAWIQCVGSRDVTVGRDYCSSVCCMYATKEAIMAIDHVPGLEATIFYNDIRAHGKGFEYYYESAKNKYGVRYRRGIISTITEDPKTKNLRLRYLADNGRIIEEKFNLVVLSTGLVPSPGTKELAERLEIGLDRFGFAATGSFSSNRTSQPGIYAAGAFETPMDIPETVMGASSAAALAMEDLADVRGTMVVEKEYPPERDVLDEEPRVGVFVCRCGTNIARVVDVPSVAEYSKALPHVVYAEENIYTCSTDTQARIINAIKEHGVNRVVVASCTPRTHEPLFQDTLREAGLNKYLFEMANIRDQCSWVHATHPREATEKAKDLVRMAAARAAVLEPLTDMSVAVIQRGLVIGGGLAGITAALSLASQGFECCLVEKEAELGGYLRHIHTTIDGLDVQQYLSHLLNRVEEEPRITVYTGAQVADFSGHVGKFITHISQNGDEITLEHGVLIMATGAAEYKPEEYGYGKSERIVTQLELEEKMASDADAFNRAKEVVMIQCVGSREEGHMYCSRVCCTEAVKNALKLKAINPDIEVTILFRDVRTYGHYELYYRTAREQGVRFIRWIPERRPQVSIKGQGVEVRVYDEPLKREVLLRPDYLVLSAGIRPREDMEELASCTKLPLTADGFFLEAHVKLRPLDFSSTGLFLCGIAHAPKLIPETIAQAQGAAARAATILSKKQLSISGVVSVVDQERCVACLTCVRVCPYFVPRINEQGVAEIEAAACHGCGICASACPRKAIEVQHYRDKQIVAKCDTFFEALARGG